MKIHNKYQLQKGFTLIELSIVLIIIGLITSAILSGSELVEQAKLRNMMTSYKKYETALTAFILKYDQLPGDITNADQYWAGAPIGNGNQQVRCNANGDECWKAFLHLDTAHAGLIEGEYNGTNTGLTIGNTTVWISFVAAGTIYAYPANHFLLAWNNMTGPQSASFDKKLDDGIPNRGKVITWAVFLSSVDCVKQADGVTNATNAYTAAAGIYNLAQTSQICSTHMIPAVSR